MTKTLHIKPKNWNSLQLHHGGIVYYTKYQRKTIIYYEGSIHLYYKQYEDIDDVYDLIYEDLPNETIELPELF